MAAKSPNNVVNIFISLKLIRVCNLSRSVVVVVVVGGAMKTKVSSRAHLIYLVLALDYIEFAMSLILSNVAFLFLPFLWQLAFTLRTETQHLPFR